MGGAGLGGLARGGGIWGKGGLAGGSGGGREDRLGGRGKEGSSEIDGTGWGGEGGGVAASVQFAANLVNCCMQTAPGRHFAAVQPPWQTLFKLQLSFLCWGSEL